MGTRSSVRFEMHMTYAELSSNKYFPYCVMGLVLHLRPLVSSKMDCSRQWIYQTCLCTKATAFFQVFFNWNIMEFLQELEASLEVPIGVGKKMQLVKIGSTLHFVIRSGIRNSEFHKQCYYQSVLAQKIFNNTSRTLKGPETIQQYMHFHLFQVLLSGRSSGGVNISVWKIDIRKQQDFKDDIFWLWHLKDEVLSSAVLTFHQ